MATITRRSSRHPAQRWQATIRRKGFPTQCRSFPTRAEAQAWANAEEVEMFRGTFIDPAPARSTTLGDLMDRYGQEVTPSKKGRIAERNRLRMMQQWSLAAYTVGNITPAVLAQWRDTRLQAVSGSTVNRELNLLSHVFRMAMTEWGIPLPFNPISRVRRPRSNPPRNRRAEGDEESRLLAACKAARNRYLLPVVVLAIETGMRRSEIVGLQWQNVDLKQHVAWLPDTKNGESRAVPLSTRACDTLRAVGTLPPNPQPANPTPPQSLQTPSSGPVFSGLTVNAVRLAYVRAARNAGCEELHLHDLRHEATSRFFEKGLNMVEVASITGHKTLSMLQRYTHLRAADLARRLG